MIRQVLTSSQYMYTNIKVLACPAQYKTDRHYNKNTNLYTFEINLG